MIGGAGGLEVPTSIAQILMLKYKYDYNLQKAIDHPRLHHQVIDAMIFFIVFCSIRFIVTGTILK